MSRGVSSGNNVLQYHRLKFPATHLERNPLCGADRFCNSSLRSACAVTLKSHSDGEMDERRRGDWNFKCVSAKVKQLNALFTGTPLLYLRCVSSQTFYTLKGPYLFLVQVLNTNIKQFFVLWTLRPRSEFSERVMGFFWDGICKKRRPHLPSPW